MSGKKWVLLVAGSKGWENYRHQANVCCLYQIIKKHRIPDEQIVVMMYDDIAQNPKNPTNGVIVSVTGDSNVYAGVPKDYTGEDVTPHNFWAALQGDGSTGKKVIQSGPNDNIYIYMTGLGEKGMFKFPEESLYPKDFTDAITSMHNQNAFSKMVIFMTSSYSATMFEGLSDKLDAFALTACNKNEKSSPSDYDESRKIYRSDKFSSAWLKFINTADFNTATFQFGLNQFGSMDIGSCHLSEFLQN